MVELRRATREQIADLRAARQQKTELPIVPRFYAGLVDEAEPFLLVETPGARAAPGDSGGEGGTAEESLSLGYALLLARDHDGHAHTTLIELGLGTGHQDRYEDALDVIRDTAQPTAYLVRTDDCRLNATLLARGLQVEPTALVMVPEEDGSTPLSAPPLELAALEPAHVAGVAELLFPEGVGTEGHEDDLSQEPKGHRHGPSAAEALDEVRAMAEAGEGWVLLEEGRAQAVLARLESEDGDYELLDFVVAEGEEAGLSWAFFTAAQEIKDAGRRPAAVIDALDTVRHRILRNAGFFTASAYMVFYDPMVGRPSVPTVGLEELRAMLKRKERFHLVDVMGEEHWKAGHLPGSEWIDFRGLGREARRRYKQDDTIVVYCNGFT